MMLSARLSVTLDDRPRRVSPTIQRYPVRKQIHGVPRFITLKAAGYFFLPSISGLRYLATKNVSGA